MSFKTAQLQPYSLNGAGAVSGATTVTLKSFQTIDGVNLAMSDFGNEGFGTIEPGNGELEEQISFTGVTQNSNGTATLTGVKSVLFLSPYTESSGLSKTHAGSTTFVISNTSGFYNQFGAKGNNETITGYWNVPDPVGMTDIANKEYVLSVVNGGSVSTNALIEVGNAGETVAAGTPVYLKAADGLWWKATGATAATVENIQLGIAQGAGTAGNPITGGVLRRGRDTHQSGGTAGLKGYISDTSTIATSAGTTSRVVGNFITATTFDFDPFFFYTLTAGQEVAIAGGGVQGTPSATNLFITETGLIQSGVFSMTAGATINGATLPVPVYQDTSTGKVLACDGDDKTKLKFFGFAVSNSTDTNPINVRTVGIVNGFTGLSVGVKYFVQDTIGTIGTSTGTYAILVGEAVSTTQLFIITSPQIQAGSFVLPTSTTTTTITTGFRPKAIRLNAMSVVTGTSGMSLAAGTWANGVLSNVLAYFFGTTSASGSDGTSGFLIQDLQGGSNFLTVTISNVTTTTFDIVITETGTYNDTGYIYWESESY